MKWFVVICCLILQLDPSKICRPLEMHLIINWQLVEYMLLICSKSVVEYLLTDYQNKVLPCSYMLHFLLGLFFFLSFFNGI